MDDLISRRDAIDAFMTSTSDGDKFEWCKWVLEQLPSAERKGKWIEHEDPYGFFDTIPVCSECGHTTKMRERYNYCPNCGAKMGRREE